ncbi:hypothetical protein [Lactobacillus sp.]|uniref:hypothetical protein n=1 Tax=Lactobacillus sp. TaxID=1591 RepID=UPI0019909E92|nr:hypothetical protein [Lactobacillus sp.]MBD5429776.1 hypothetical protein [Lactobacillus sp.]
MEFDTEKFKQKLNEKTDELAEAAQSGIESFKENQWPKIKDTIDETSFGKKYGKKIWHKSKQSFKDGVRKLDQWVNGSSVHRDDK